MELRSTRIIDAPIDQLWALQLAHEQWPTHLPGVRKVVRGDAAFGVGSSATITQPGLGTVEWTVVHFDEHPGERSYAWTARTRGMHYLASHDVVSHGDQGTTLTLGLTVGGPMAALMGPLLKGRMQKAIDAEAAAFERWAAAASVR